MFAKALKLSRLWVETNTNGSCSSWFQALGAFSNETSSSANDSWFKKIRPQQRKSFVNYFKLHSATGSQAGRARVPAVSPCDFFAAMLHASVPHNGFSKYDDRSCALMQRCCTHAFCSLVSQHRESQLAKMGALALGD